MAECELIEKCIFFNDAMKFMPASAAMFKLNYCKTDNSKCARYTVFKTLGKGSVPGDLFPNQVERALQLIAAHPTQPNPHRRWVLPENALVGLTPAKAKDYILQCFLESQKETFERAEKRAWGSANEAEVKANLLALVKSICSDFGINLENPSKRNLTTLLTEIRKVAESWGTPQEILEFHKAQIKTLLDALKD